MFLIWTTSCFERDGMQRAACCIHLLFEPNHEDMVIFIHVVLDSTTFENLVTIWWAPTMHNAIHGGSLMQDGMRALDTETTEVYFRWQTQLDH
jgi:hypothetical protein